MAFFFSSYLPPSPTPRDLMLKALLCSLNSNHLRFCFGPCSEQYQPRATESEPHFINQVMHICIKFEKHWLKIHNLVSFLPHGVYGELQIAHQRSLWLFSKQGSHGKF